VTANSPSQRVHRFEVVGANELPEMNRLQRSFFSKHYRPRSLAGDAIDVDGQFGYPVVMLHELLAEWDVEPKTAMEGAARIIDAYPKSVAQSEARQCLADMHYLREEWADALKLTYGFRRLVAFVGLSDLLQPRAEAWEVMRWGSSNITKAGWQNLDAALDDLQGTLDRFHDERGISIIGHFWRRLHANETTEAIAQSLYDLIGSDYSVDQIVQLIDHGRTVGPYPLTAFQGFAGYERPIPSTWNRSNPYAFEGLIRALPCSANRRTARVRPLDSRASARAWCPRYVCCINYVLRSPTSESTTRYGHRGWHHNPSTWCSAGETSRSSTRAPNTRARLSSSVDGRLSSGSSSATLRSVGCALSTG
jgi:hypothetical protein